MRRLAGTALLAIGLSGCPGFGDKTLAEIEGITEVPTYHQDVAPILERYCTACHTDPPIAGAPQPLLNFTQAEADAERIRVRAVQLGDMPPGGGVSDGDKAILEAWVAGGVPEGESTGEPEPTPDMGEPEPQPDLGVDETPTWATVEPILAQHCTACHTDPPIAGAPQPLLTFEQAQADAERIRVRVVDQDTMPPGGGVPDAQKAILEAWVEAGAPEE